MKVVLNLILILSLSVILSCNKDNGPEISESDYLIFGHFYGECLGERCVETYMLTNDKLYEDEKDHYFGSDPFDFQELPKDKFELVNDLMDYFPPELLNDTNKTFGCPDCADQGGLLLKLAENGDVRSWRIDQSKYTVPLYLHDFMDSINVRISLLNK